MRSIGDENGKAHLKVGTISARELAMAWSVTPQPQTTFSTSLGQTVEEARETTSADHTAS